MSNMQTFHQWLFSSAMQKPGAYQRRLASLTRISRLQILNIASGMTWVIWETDQPASA
jgi:hypothetical protein